LANQELAAYHSFLSDETLHAQYGMTWRDIFAPLIQAEKAFKKAAAPVLVIDKKLIDRLLHKFDAFPLPLELPAPLVSGFLVCQTRI
jgi:hypothetical protein